MYITLLDLHILSESRFKNIHIIFNVWHDLAHKIQIPVQMIHPL